MSQWATICQYLKQISGLVLWHKGFGRLVLLFVIAVSLTLIISDNYAIADMLLQSPPMSPPAEPPPAEQPPVEAAPVEAQSPQSEPTFQSPVETIPSESTVIPDGSQPPPMAQPTIPASSQEREDSFSDDEGEESSGFILDQVEFIDTVVVSGAYIWLCCGIGLFLLIPLVFLLLQIRGQLKIRKEDDF